MAESNGVREDRDLPVEHQWLPQPVKPGGQQPADCGGPLLEHHGDVRRPDVEEVEGDTDGGAAEVATSSLNLLLPPAVEADRVACPPAFSILWKTSSKRVSSSPIFLQNLN